MMKTNQNPVYNPNFGVYDEWGPLKHCLVGTVKTFRFPDSVKVGFEAGTPELRDFFAKGAGRLFKDVYPKEFEEFQGELDALADIIASNGIKVERPFEFTEGELAMVPPGESGIWQLTSADQIWVVGNTYLELRMRTPMLRKNVFWQRRQYSDTVLNNGGEMLFAPPLAPGKTPGSMNYTGFIDGGDIIQYGRDVLCGVDSVSTDEVGFAWFKRNMEARGYRVHRQTFNMIEIHLLAQMNIISPNLGLMCDEGFEGHEKCDFLTKGAGKDIKFIKVTPEEVHGGGCDVVMLDEKKVLVSSQQPRLADELAKNGLEPITVPLTWAPKFASGIRCCMNILHRDKSDSTDLNI